MERYVLSNGRRLRCGITTGTCSAAASRAAAELLLTGHAPETVTLLLPDGETAHVPIRETRLEADAAYARVDKDSGDDPDITNGTAIWARVALRAEPGIAIDGGEGIGRVTLPGLDQPVGNAAINSVPRRQITEAVQSVLELTGCPGGAEVIISIPAGAELAKRTFNPRLGIIGGISVLGTSGVVEPMSEQALIDSIRLEIRMRAARGKRVLLLTPGNYGRDFLKSQVELPDEALVRFSNFLGEALDEAREQPYEELLLVSHLGKLVKVAGNMFNTHSKYGDCRMDIMTAHAAKQGISAQTARALMACATVDAALTELEHAGVMRETLSSVLAAVESNLALRAGRTVRVATFTNVRGPLAQSEGFDEALAALLKEES